MFSENVKHSILSPTIRFRTSKHCVMHMIYRDSPNARKDIALTIIDQLKKRALKETGPFESKTSRQRQLCFLGRKWRGLSFLTSPPSPAAMTVLIVAQLPLDKQQGSEFSVKVV